MRIAIQAADLDGERIDGTRIYLSELLKRLGQSGPKDAWHLYHRRSFNPNLTPPKFSNYHVHTVESFGYWTQTRFAWELFKLRPEVLWMPVQALPFVQPRGMRTIVTIHDLAFKYFPEHFPKKDARRLNWFTDYAIRHADRLIAVSQATKRDILKFYPEVGSDKIRVIYHGFNQDFLAGSPKGQWNLDSRLRGNDKASVLSKSYPPAGEAGKLEARSYLLYVGAIQPRKNLGVLLQAFERAKQKAPEMKLVLAGEKAWLWESTFKAIEDHPYRKDIIITGQVSFRKLQALYRNARIFIFPSLYEGFGLPVLEAQVSGVPVICADNSSLPEVGGNAAVYFNATNIEALTERILSFWQDEALRQKHIALGYENVKRFSWDRCAEETYQTIVHAR